MRDAADTPQTRFQSHLPLVTHAVISIANRLPSSTGHTDLVAAGVAALLRAAADFDPGKGAPFTAVAKRSIERALLEQLRGRATAGVGVDAAVVAQISAEVARAAAVNHGAIVLGAGAELREQRQVAPGKAAQYAAISAASDSRTRVSQPDPVAPERAAAAGSRT